MAEAIFEVFRGNREGGQPATYRVPIAPGMVVLDALHHIQAHQAPDLAVRWNCKQASAARAPLKSTDGLGSLAKPVWTLFPSTSPSPSTR